MSYKIEARYTYGWDDAGWSESSGSRWKPLRFPTRAAAEEALREYFEAVKKAVAAGSMDREECVADFRVAEVRDRSARGGAGGEKENEKE